MHYLYLDGTDRTGDLQENTPQKENQSQQRADTLHFTLFQGAKPTENSDVKFYMGDTVASIVGAVIQLTGDFERNVNKFYTGQVLHIRIGQTNETTATVLTYVESTLTLTLTANPSVTLSAGDRIGELIFGGVASRCKDQNIQVLTNIEYPTECVSYDKIFDKKLIADTWASVDGRYVINDFLNTTVNYNSTLDNISYVDNAAIQAEWIVGSGSGASPTVDSSDYLEATSSGVFTAGGVGFSRWSASPSTTNIALLTGVNSGTPTKGFLMLWIKLADYTKVNGIVLHIGSDASNLASMTIVPAQTNDWQYINANLKAAIITGTPDWTAVDHIAIYCNASAATSFKANGFRVNSDGSFTAKGLVSTILLTTFRANNVKPTALMQTLAKNFSYMWDIDYERDVKFAPVGTTSSPFNLSDTSDNFGEMTLEVDQSQLGNSVIVQGGLANSVSRYAQVIPGDNAKREWLLKAKFNTLAITIDDGTTTHAAVAGTTTTNIKIIGHGLTSGMHIVNQTRSNAVREITVVDADNFTVETVASQTSGDTISFFATTVTIGIEGIDDETLFDYMSNYNNQSVRNSTQTLTLPATSFIRFEYYEKITVQTKYIDSASANALKALGLGDGEFDLLPITDTSIIDLGTAVALAQAKVQDYKNPIITITFKTDQNGLKAGQIIHVQDSVRGIDDDYMIQIVKGRQSSGQFKDYWLYDVTAGTTLFGMIEFLQKLLASQSQVADNVDTIIETYVVSSEDITMTAVEAATKGGFKKATIAEDIHTHADEVALKHSASYWHWEPSSGQDMPTRWNLANWN